MAEKNKSKDIQIIRIYDAPVAMVWDAWTDPKKAAKWWGPRGFTITTHKHDLRPGGSWDYMMHGPDGTDYHNITKYFEVEKQSRLVYDHGGNEKQPPLFRVTANFTEMKGNRTKLEMTMSLPTPEAAEETRAFIKKAGGNATWDRFAEYLEKQTSGKEIFVINRSFDAPIDVVFDMWTDPKHVCQWVPPTGFTMEYINVSIKPGGSAFYVMTGPNNLKMYGTAQYMEIRKPDRLVYTQQFSDEKGNVARHPMAPTWPESMLTTVTLVSEGADKTRVTIQWEVVGKCTPEEMETFIKGRAGMTQGWTGSLDKLEAYLASR